MRKVWFMTKRDKRLIVIIVITILSMIGLLSYGIYTKHQQGKIIQSYERKVETETDNVEADLQKASEYNSAIQDFLNNRGTSSTVNSVEMYNDIFSENDGMIGVVIVPKSNIRLPIYHGTSDETLDKGVGHVSDTAFPMDTIGTKSVLTGHNGYPGADMLFTRLDETEIGDTFVVQIGDIAYHYEVKQMTVITPDEAEVYAQEPINSDAPANVTLITCTPYGINSHRLLVIGEFVKKGKVTEDKKIVPKSKFSIGKETIFILIVSGLGIGLIGFVVYKAKQNAKIDAYNGYEVEDQYWDVN